MIDPGSDLINIPDKFESYPMKKTLAGGTTYSSAAGKQAEHIVDVGPKCIRDVDEHGTETWAEFQMCSGLGRDKSLGSAKQVG